MYYASVSQWDVLDSQGGISVMNVVVKKCTWWQFEMGDESR